MAIGMMVLCKTERACSADSRRWPENQHSVAANILGRVRNTLVGNVQMESRTGVGHPRTVQDSDPSNSGDKLPLPLLNSRSQARF